MALRRITDATTEPVTLAEAKDYLRITGADHDAVITGLIVVARQVAENELKRSLISQTWERTLDAFPDAIELSYPPIISITWVRYYDTAGVLQSLASGYTLDNASEPGWLVPAAGYEWPATLEDVNAVSIRYVAGYGSDATTVPEPIKTWIKLTVGHYFENREASIVAAGQGIQPLPFVGGLIDPYRIVGF